MFESLESKPPAWPLLGYRPFVPLSVYEKMVCCLSEFEKTFFELGWYQGLLLVQPSVAMKMIDVAEAAGVIVISITGYRIFDGLLQADNKHSLDLPNENSNDIARQFLRGRLGNDQWFSIGTLSPEELDDQYEDG